MPCLGKAITGSHLLRTALASSGTWQLAVGKQSSVAKMINLGFIEHGATGFYNQQGEAIQGGHHH